MRTIINTAGFATELENMKNDTKTYGSSDIVELAEIDVRLDLVDESCASELTRLKIKYDAEIAAAKAEDRDVRISDKDYANSMQSILDNVNLRIQYLTSLKYATSFKSYQVIRNFEYRKRYFTRYQNGYETNGDPKYEYVRYNCYQFKTKDALYDAPTYNIDTGWAMVLQNDPGRRIRKRRR